MRILLLSFLFLALSSSAQERPLSVLIDEFERIPCDDLLSRLDSFYVQIQSKPGSTGYVVFFGENGNMRANVFYEEMIKAFFEKKHSARWVTSIRSSLAPKLTMQFWIVPPGADPPKSKTVEWSYKLATNEKPYKFTWLDEYDDICPEVDGVRLYADFLKANPAARGNIVIRDNTVRKIRRHRVSVLDTLTKFGVAANKLRFFEAIGTPDGINQRIEYWLVP